MLQRIGCCALTLTLLTAASMSEASSIDCWLLDGSRLEQARDQGLCEDPFSRNTQEGVAPTVSQTETSSAMQTQVLPPPPPRKPTASKAQPKASAKGKAKAGPKRNGVKTVQEVRPGRPADPDFGSNFQKDWNALVRALGDVFAQPPGAGPRPRLEGARHAPPSHLDPNDR